MLDGQGVLHAGDASIRCGPGSCIQLPARTVHCLENTGAGTMRVVAVFRPAGSPAAAYYPDGHAGLRAGAVARRSQTERKHPKRRRLTI